MENQQNSLSSPTQKYMHCFILSIMRIVESILGFCKNVHTISPPQKGKDGGSVQKAKHDGKLKPVISPDIVAEILSRLPLKTLSRFQLVCKEWQALIHNHYFLEKHMAHTKYIKHFYNTIKRVNPSTHVSEFRYIDGCDGLLIFMNRVSRKYFLWNPAICRVLELPDPHKGQYNYKLDLFYVPASNNYRLVSMYQDRESGKRGCEVFTPGLDMSWRSLTFPDTASANERSWGYVVSAGGAAHCVLGDESIREIVTLDVATERFAVNHLPDGVFSKKDKVQALDWDGKLAIVGIVGKNMQLVELKDSRRNKWCGKRMISLPFLKDDGTEEKLFPLLNKQGEVWFRMKDEKIFSYSIETERVNVIREEGGFSNTTGIYPYKPSLVSFKGMQPDTFLESYRLDIRHHLLHNT